MSYNPSYGGQFQGLSAIRKETAATEKKSPSKWVKVGSRPAEGEGGAVAVGSAAAAGGVEVPKKLVCSFQSLTGVKMPAVAAEDRRDFFAAAVFEDDDLNEVMKHRSSRTPVMKGSMQNEAWHAGFCDALLVLPIVNPSKRCRFYVCAVTTTHHEEGGRRTRDIALMGIGYTESFFMDRCKDYGRKVLELKPVQDGDPSVVPGKLEVSVRCCGGSEGPPIPEDVEDNVLEMFQAKLDEDLKKKAAEM